MSWVLLPQRKAWTFGFQTKSHSVILPPCNTSLKLGYRLFHRNTLMEIKLGLQHPSVESKHWANCTAFTEIYASFREVIPSGDSRQSRAKTRVSQQSSQRQTVSHENLLVFKLSFTENMSIKANPVLIQYRNYLRVIWEERKTGSTLTGRVKKAGCFASSSYLPSVELPASMDLDVVFLPIPIIKRKWVVWPLDWSGSTWRLFKQGAQDQSWLFQCLKHPILRQRWAPQAPSLST